MALTGHYYVELLTKHPIFQHFPQKKSINVAIHKELVYIRDN